MTIDTYSELLTEVADWTKRSDMTARIPLFVAMGESAMNSRLRLRTMETTASLSLASGYTTATLPTGFLEPISLAYTDGDYGLVQVPRDVLDSSRAFASVSASGRPKWYAYSATTVDFDRTADVNYTLTLRYTKKLDLATDLTNAVLTAAPYAYLYGALQAYSNWNEDAEGLAKYASLFQQELKQLELSDFASRGSAPMRTDLPAVLGAGQFDITTG